MTVVKLPAMNASSSLCDRIASYAEAGVDSINRRLVELDREWTAGRAMKASLGVVIVLGFILAAWHDPLWLLLPAVAGALLLQYLFFRRSLVADLFQWLGLRSMHEIDEERFALRALRGDYRNLPTVEEVEDTDSISRLEGEGGPALAEEARRYAPREVAELITATAQS